MRTHGELTAFQLRNRLATYPGGSSTDEKIGEPDVEMLVGRGIDPFRIALNDVHGARAFTRDDASRLGCERRRASRSISKHVRVR